MVALAFDKLDVEKGMEVRGPRGELRWLKHPWSVLAFQIAGADGIRALHAEGRDKGRETAPAEPLLVDLLARPQAEGLATLVLIDEVLMFARGEVADAVEVKLLAEVRATKGLIQGTRAFGARVHMRPTLHPGPK